MIVKVFPYKTAMVDDIFLTVDRDLLKNFEESLVDTAPHPLVRKTDNHVVYEVHDHGIVTYIRFSDGIVEFGRTLSLTASGEGQEDTLPLWE